MFFMNQYLVVLPLLFGAAGVSSLTQAEDVTDFKALTFLGFGESGRSNDANEGLRAIFAGQIFHQAVPAVAVRLALGGSREALGYDPNSPEGKFYFAGSLPSPPDRGVGGDPSFGLGLSLIERNGTKMVTINCFQCHAGVVNGQIVAGLGNSHINQAPPRGQTVTRGDNLGPYEVWKLTASLEDPANKGLAIAREKTELQKLLQTRLPNVDPMPWWTMKYKKLDYWYADAGIHDAASFSINFSTPHPGLNDQHAEHVKTVATALAFARECESPSYPDRLNPERVQRGADLFHGRARPENPNGFTACTTCHGSYTKKPSTEVSQPGSWFVSYEFSHVLRNVKTDTAYNDLLQTFGPIVEHGGKIKSYYEKMGTPELTPHASIPKKPGYVAPPLVGVWASAPYFHNGSVPTLEAVLNSKMRPEIWSRDNRDPFAYDLKGVGMKHGVVSREEFAKSASEATGKHNRSRAVLDHSALYDTKAFGHGNGGHTFGDNLTVDERFALIEFLKSLSGSDMPPANGQTLATTEQ